jgi:mannose-1-phosphate guanylyltransferase
MSTEAYAVIMAGGSGTRFWPASRRDRPKQLLALGPTGEIMLAATVRRIERVIPAANILIVTSATLAEATRAAVPHLASDQVLAEPVGRNTAPCVAWAAATVSRRNPDGVLAVLPADHHIGDEDEYARVLERAIAAAADGDMVTVGLQPNRPETGYGYIEVGEPIAKGVHRARRFVEKPNRQRAEQFLAAGGYLWNSGMFFFRADRVLASIRVHLPRIGAAMDEIDAAAGRGEEASTVERLYPDLPSVSIDHGIMEKADRVAVVPADFGWSDLGSWISAWELAAHDEADNVLPPDGLAVASRRSFARVPAGKLVALVGVEDILIVDTEDALLVVHKDCAQDVREIVARLEARNDGRT